MGAKIKFTEMEVTDYPVLPDFGGHGLHGFSLIFYPYSTRDKTVSHYS